MVVLVVELSSLGFIGMSCVDASYQRQGNPALIFNTANCMNCLACADDCVVYFS